MPDLADLYPGYAAEWINTSSGRIFARVGGKGPPLLLLHGFSETHVMWHRVAPQLGDKFTLIIADLPGYGWSDMPESDKDHTPYTKRAMAKTMVEAMEQLGHVHFSLAGHDRGGRVAYRLALDHPGRLSRLAVLDILPTYDYWERMNRLYALKIYHWTFLAQPAPLPETLIGGNPDFFLKQKMASQTKKKNLDAIDKRALEHYLAAFRDPSRVHAMCEDYRAGAYADFEIDKKDHDLAKKITIPMLALWGDAGIASVSGDAARHLEELGDRRLGCADRFRAFFDRGKPGRHRQGAEGVFCGGVSLSPSLRGARSNPIFPRVGMDCFASLAMTKRQLPSHPEKLLQQCRGLGFADRGIDLGHVMAGFRCKEAHAGIDRAALGVGRAVIEPPDPRKRDRPRTHRARLQRDIKIAIDQPLGPDRLGGLPDRQNFGMRGRIAVGQRAVAGRGDDLVTADNDASDRDLAGFSGIFRRFQGQIHERRGLHPSYHRKKPATGNPFSKSGYRFCVRLRLDERARALPL